MVIESQLFFFADEVIRSDLDADLQQVILSSIVDIVAKGFFSIFYFIIPKWVVTETGLTRPV